MPNSPLVTWQPAHPAPVASLHKPGLADAMRRGALGACPACGKGKLFSGFLRPAEFCTACNAPLGRVRADDVPPYVTIMIVGHIIVPMMLWLERAETPPLWVHSVIWLPLTLLLTIGLLRPVKGAIIGLMMHLGLPKLDGAIEGARREADA